jgi:23S rRNA A2030 N6-methylase RlmJ
VRREPRLERLELASRHLRARLRELDDEELEHMRQLLERVLETQVLDRDGLADLEAALLPR